MTENKRYTVKGSDDFFLHIEDTTFTEDKHEGAIYNIYQVVDRLNEQEETIQDLLKYKYLVKALEEVSGSHYIEEIISDYSDGAVSNEKEQLELGKWHSEHGLSWEDSDVDE